jgi:hypothetical protein
MLQEKTFIIAIIIGIAVIISTISLLSISLNTERDDWWSYNTMRDKLIQSELEPSNVIELEDGLKFQTERKTP